MLFSKYNLEFSDFCFLNCLAIKDDLVPGTLWALELQQETKHKMPVLELLGVGSD